MEPATASLEAFAAAARRMYDRGLYRFQFAEAEFLTQLHLVEDEIERSQPIEGSLRLSREEREAISRTVIERIIDGLGEEMRALMGTAPRLRRRTRTDRLRAAATKRGLNSPTSFRYYRERILPEMIDDLSKALFRLEQRVARQRAAAGKGPSDSLAMDWLRRHEYYSDIWTAVWAIQADLAPLVNLKRRLTEAEVREFEISSLYWWGMYWIGLARFREECRGIWILADADAEQQVMDAIYEIGLVAGIEALDQSWLRDFLRDIDHQELDRFAQWLPRDARGDRILSEWRAWIAGCHCGADPEEGCKVHHVMAQCEAYTRFVDEDWYAIVGWYRKRPTVHDGIARYAYLRRLFGPRAADG